MKVRNVCVYDSRVERQLVLINNIQDGVGFWGAARFLSIRAGSHAGAVAANCTWPYFFSSYLQIPCYSSLDCHFLLRMEGLLDAESQVKKKIDINPPPLYRHILLLSLHLFLSSFPIFIRFSAHLAPEDSIFISIFLSFYNLSKNHKTFNLYCVTRLSKKDISENSS